MPKVGELPESSVSADFDVRSCSVRIMNYNGRGGEGVGWKGGEGGGRECWIGEWYLWKWRCELKNKVPGPER
eukprot:768046-Hanusia_phi.AAC.3